MKKTLVIVLILMMLHSVGCQQEEIDSTNQMQEEIEQTKVLEAPSSEMKIQTEVKGTIVDVAKIDNEVGGYYIPIPDAWFGKTSYEIYKDETYIYHITLDKDVGDNNPLLLHVGASYDVDPTNLYQAAQVFLQMDEVKFYSIPVFDLPYTPGSKDGNEYEILFADIPMMLQSVWVMDETKWQNKIEQEFNQVDEFVVSDIRPFSKNDAMINGLSLGSLKDNVLHNLPSEYVLESVDAFELGATGEMVEDYYYSFGILTFTDSIFTGAQIIDAAIAGPRDICVGDNIDDLPGLFSFAAEGDFVNGMIVYRANEGDDDDVILPPSCVIYDSSFGSTLSLDCFENENILKEIRIDELKDIYMYEPIYSCSFEADDYGEIISYWLNYGAMAE